MTNELRNKKVVGEYPRRMERHVDGSVTIHVGSSGLTAGPVRGREVWTAMRNAGYARKVLRGRA